MAAAGEAEDRGTLADVNGDGLADFLSPRYLPGQSTWQVVCWLRETTGGFSAPVVTTTQTLGRDLALADASGDGVPDLFLASDEFGQDRLVWLQGDGSGGFHTEVTLSSGAPHTCVLVGDLHPSAGDEIVYANLDSPDHKVEIRSMNAGAGFPVLQSISMGSEWPVSLRSADLDEDGFLELVMVLDTSEEIEVWSQTLGGLTLSQEIGGLGDQTRDVALGDLDGDGDTDAAVVSYGGSDALRLLSNDGSGLLGLGPTATIPQAWNASFIPHAGTPQVAVASRQGAVYLASLFQGSWTLQTLEPLTTSGTSGVDLRSVHWGGFTLGQDPVLIAHSVQHAPTFWTDFTAVDCNGNGQLDSDDIAAGTSADCNQNGVPDECDVTNGLDCDGNGNPDACDIANDLSIDCNGNGVIDTCEVNADPSLDCNGNGIPDSCDIASGFALDCNNNGIPDSCDLASDPALDANLNDVLDICEGPGRTWILSAVTGNWYATTDELTADAAEQQAQNWGGHLVAISDPTENDWIAATFGDATNPVWIGLTDFDVEGNFVWWNGEDYTWSNWAANEPDNGGIIGSDFTLLHPATGEWTDEPRTVLARGVVELVAGDCDGNGIPDAYEALGDPSLDCDGNGTFDTCDLADPANDCDGDGLLDACEIDGDPSLDCDGNGQLDACEILADWSLDCDLDDVMDACQIAADPSLDCDLDGVLDSCQIALDAALDCDADGVLDTCQLEDPANDWDGSGVLDACEGGAPVYCVGNLNATGTNGKLEAQGSPLIADNSFTLHGWDLPTGVPAYFVFSRLTGDINPFGGGLGRLCLGPPIRRFNPANGYGILFTSGTGEVLFTPDLGNIPQTPIAPGETLHFQLWHREFDSNSGSQTSNTSDAIEVMFR